MENNLKKIQKIEEEIGSKNKSLKKLKKEKNLGDEFWKLDREIKILKQKKTALKNQMKEKKPIKKVSDKKIKRLANGGSEPSLFLKIKIKRRTTDLTGRPIIGKSRQFAHILPKGQYPEYRLNENNIIVVDSIEQHERVDQMTARRRYVIKEMVDRGEAIQYLSDLRKMKGGL